MRAHLPPPLAALAVLALLAAAAPAGAAFTKTYPYHAETGMPGGPEGGGSITVLSGRLQVELGPTSGSFGFWNVTPVTATGLQHVCWGNAAADCAFAPNGTLMVRALAGSDIGMGFPGIVTSSFEARHVLAIVADFGGEEDLNGLGIGESLLVSGQGAEMRFASIPSVDVRPGTIGDDAVNWVSLDAGTRIEVLRGAESLAIVSGRDVTVRFEGEVAITPFGSELAVLPFEGQAVAHLRRAAARDAERGANLDALQRLTRSLDEANQGEGQQGQADTPESPFADLLGRILNGNIIHLPGDEAASGADLEIVRFTRLTVQRGGDGILWDGRAALEVSDGHVQHARPLVGFGFLSLPWWSWLLWAAAITLAVVAFVRKAPKASERWDRLKWVGWIAGPAAFVLVFILWDLETRFMWGASILTGGLSGRALGVMAVLQLAPYFLMVFATVAPLRIILSRSFRLAGQGTFMNLSSAIALLLGFLLGIWYLRSFLDLFVERLVEQLAGQG